MANEHVYQCRICGVDYTLRGDKTPEEMARIVRMLEEKMERIQAAKPNYSAVRALTLSALQLAEELYDERQDYRQVLAEADIGAEYDLFSQK